MGYIFPDPCGTMVKNQTEEMEMARRSTKNMTTAEKLEMVENQILEMESSFKELKAQKKELLEQKKQEDLDELYQIISESGKSIQEVKEMLQ